MSNRMVFVLANSLIGGVLVDFLKKYFDKLFPDFERNCVTRMALTFTSRGGQLPSLLEFVVNMSTYCKKKMDLQISF